MAPNHSAASLVTALANQTHIPVTQLFHKGEIAGKGAFGSVHRGIHIGTGAVVALKIVNLDIADDDVEAIQKEVSLLSQLRGGESTNVTQYYGCWLDGPKVWIVMDFASGGSVRTLMKATKGGVLEERHTVIIVREVLVALSFIQKAGVIHRDIKAANILVTAQGRVVLCDFGVSGLLATAHSKRATMVGTPYWMAPEVIAGSPYDTKADIWSLGVTIYEMMMGTPPHSDQVPMRAFILITTGPPPRLPDSTGCSKDMKEFMAMCLKELPNDRLTADELSKSKWIKAAKTPVTTLKELLASYNGWVQKGGVRDSILGDGNDYFDNEDGEEANWEFDTIRMSSDTTANDPEHVPIPGENTGATASTYQAPRSLRMLFEDSSIPPALSESFLRNNLGSSRQHIPTQSSGIAASMPSNPTFLLPAGSANAGSTPFDPSTSAPDDSLLQTARQPNFSFPRVVTPKAEFEDVTAKLSSKRGHHSPKGSGARRSPSPLKDLRSPPTSPQVIKAASTFKDVRNTKGLADIAIPPAGQPSFASVSSNSPADPADGMPSISVGRADTPIRPGTSMSINDDGSPKASSKIRKAASPMNFQFPPPSGGRVPKGGAGQSGLHDREGSSTPQPPQIRPSTPSSKDPTARLGTSFQETSILASNGLSPPKPPSLHHPASRSMDSPRSIASASGPGAVTTMSPPVLGRSHTATVYGSQSDSEALGRGLDGTRLVPGRNMALKRQASVETGLSLGGMRNGSLREALQLSAATPNGMSGIVPAELLPPSPSTSMSYSGRGFGPASDTATLESAGSVVGIHPSSSTTSVAQSHASSLQTSSTSTTSASASISSTTSVSTAYGPPVQPFNYSILGTADDVQGELAKVVEDLATWLSVVENGLSGVLEGVGYGRNGISADENAEGEYMAVDDSFDFEGEDDEQDWQERLPAR